MSCLIDTINFLQKVFYSSCVSTWDVILTSCKTKQWIVIKHYATVIFDNQMVLGLSLRKE